jgi:hypothetical protein
MGKKEMSVQDVLDALATIDVLGRLEEQKQPTLAKQASTPLAKRVQQLEEILVKPIKANPRGAKKGAQHWKAKKKRKQEKTHARYIKRKLQRTQDFIDTLQGEDPKGWWKWWRRVNNSSWKIKPGWEITLEDYTQYVHEKVVGKICIIRRHDTKKPYTLDNTLWVEQDTGLVLFDGTEHKLRLLGYIL